MSSASCIFASLGACCGDWHSRRYSNIIDLNFREFGSTATIHIVRPSFFDTENASSS